VLVRRGKGGKRREVGMDRWAWEHYSDALVMPTWRGACFADCGIATFSIGIIRRAGYGWRPSARRLSVVRLCGLRPCARRPRRTGRAEG
jgi:hypothetical protein